MSKKNKLRIFFYSNSALFVGGGTRAGDPESERPKPHDFSGAILFFLQEPEHFKKLE